VTGPTFPTHVGVTAGTHSFGAGFSAVNTPKPEHPPRFRFDSERSVWIAEEWRADRDKYAAVRTLELPESASDDEVVAAYRASRRGRSSAEYRAAGMVDLGVRLPVELLERVDAAAKRGGVSRAEYVAGWARSLGKPGKSSNRCGTPK
jgi:hypothetical protein